MLTRVLLPRIWQDAIAWALGGPANDGSGSRRLRAIRDARGDLDQITEWRALILHAAEHGFRRADLLAERDPVAWRGLDPHAATAAAYGLRYVELAVGRDIDLTRPLPYWLREWTTG